MTLYESNFVRLGWLVSDLRAVAAQRVSHVESDCDLFLTPVELNRYTSVFRLTYEFDFEGAPLRDPDLEVCVYHDARLAEVRSFRGFQRHPQLAKLYDLGAHTGSFACVKCGHVFSFREKAELAASRRN